MAAPRIAAVIPARFASTRFPGKPLADRTGRPLIQHVIPEIIDRVNRFFGYRAVSRVKLRQGAVKADPAQKPAAPPPSLKPIPMELGDSLRDIGDPELRTVLESLARSLGSKEES